MGGGGEVAVGERSFYTRDDECVVNSKVYAAGIGVGLQATPV